MKRVLKGFDDLKEALDAKGTPPERRVFIGLPVSQARAILRFLERNGLVKP